MTEIKGRLASFEEWDAWVRHTVIYADELKPGMFGDVMDVVQTNQSVDPEQETLAALLSAWEQSFGIRAISVAELLAKATNYWGGDECKKLCEALEALTNADRRQLTAKSVGRFLAYRLGRIAGGRVLRKGPKVDDRQTWRVEVFTCPPTVP